jgi:hypothetical protein
LRQPYNQIPGRWPAGFLIFRLLLAWSKLTSGGSFARFRLLSIALKNQVRIASVHR